MTIEERYELSCYQELTKLNDAKNIWLVRHNETGMIYIKKEMQWYNEEVYLRLKAANVPNIPKIYLCVRDDSTLTVIEEYIHGVSLDKLLEQQGILPEARVIEIAVAICNILEQLHAGLPPIVHRDIKPSNIMISNDGIVKLIDFNAAKEFDQSQIEDTRLMGTRKFAAPEQYGFGQSDPRTDLYALGVTMYYLLTKDYPDSGLYHGPLEPVIRKCIALDRSERYPDAAALRAELLKYTDPNMVQTTTENTKSVDNDSDSSGNIFTKHFYSYREKLPVGFRSGVIWKMLTAVWGYLFIFWLCRSMTTTASDGSSMTGYPLFVNRAGAFLMLIGIVYFLGNYCHVRDQLPFMQRSRALHWILTVVYLFIYCILMFSLVFFLGGE